MPEAYERSIKPLFEDAQLRVPIYQRAYAWTKQEVHDLLNDIDYVASRLESTTADSERVYHYFGTLVLDEASKDAGPSRQSWTAYDIIDGQQRITTVSVLMACLVEELDTLAPHFETAEIDADDLPDGIYR